MEVELGGTRIDRHDGAFMDTWSDFVQDASKRPGFNEMIGRYSAYDPASATNSFNTQRTLYIPIQFYFCRFPGLSIPLVALQFSELRINIELSNYLSCIRSTRLPVTSLMTALGQAPSLVDSQLFAEMVYLDSQERRTMSQISHEYLIEQTQFLGDQPVLVNSPTTRIDLFLNHPVKAIFWTFISRDNQTVDTLNGNRWFDWQHDVLPLLICRSQAHRVSSRVQAVTSVWCRVTSTSTTSHPQASMRTPLHCLLSSRSLLGNATSHGWMVRSWLSRCHLEFQTDTSKSGR